MSAESGKAQPVAWRFYATGSDWLKDDWTLWSTCEHFKANCEKLGYKVEFAYTESCHDPVRDALVEALKGFVNNSSAQVNMPAECERAEAALRAAGVATFGGLEKTL